MGELRKIENGFRVRCDCGNWIHDVTKENGKLDMESYRTSKKGDDPTKADPPAAPAAPAPDQNDPFL